MKTPLDNIRYTYSKLGKKLQPFIYNQLGSSDLEDWSSEQKLTANMVRFASHKVGGNISVQIFPRRMVRDVWKYEMEGEPYTLKPYAFRAFARGNQIVIFDDETETKDSLLWLLLHEVGHVWVTRTPKLRKQFRSKVLPSGYMTSDSAHESSPEEQFANMMADSWYREATGKPGSFHRIWWRDRVLRTLRKK